MDREAQVKENGGDRFGGFRLEPFVVQGYVILISIFVEACRLGFINCG